MSNVLFTNDDDTILVIQMNNSEQIEELFKELERTGKVVVDIGVEDDTVKIDFNYVEIISDKAAELLMKEDEEDEDEIVSKILSDQTIIDAVLDVLDAAQVVIDAEQVVIDAEQVVIDAEQTIIDAEQTIIDAEQVVIDSEQVVIDSEQTIIDSEQTIIDSEQVVIDAEQVVLDVLDAAGNILVNLEDNGKTFL